MTVDRTSPARPSPGAPNWAGGLVGGGVVVFGLLLLLLAMGIGERAAWLVVVGPMLMAAGLVSAAYCFADASPRRTFCQGCGRPLRRAARFCPTCGRRA